MATVTKEDIRKVVRYTSKTACGFQSVSRYGRLCILLKVDEKKYRVMVQFPDGVIYRDVHISDVTLDLSPLSLV